MAAPNAGARCSDAPGTGLELRIACFEHTSVDELALTLLAALPPGLWLGYLAAWGISRIHQTEMFRIPVVVAPATYARAAAIVLVAGVATALLVRRRVDRLDLVSVLKTRE